MAQKNRHMLAARAARQNPEMMTVAPGTESGGDAAAQEIRDTPDQAMERVVCAAARLLGSHATAKQALLGPLHDLATAQSNWAGWEAVHNAKALLTEVREDELTAVRYELDELHLSPFRGVEMHSAFVAEMLQRFDALIATAQQSTGQITEVIILRQAVQIAQRLINSRIGQQINAAETQPPTTTAKSRKRRTATWLERQEANRRFAASCPSGSQGRQSAQSSKKKGKGKQ